MKENKRGIGFKFAWSGIKVAFQTEKNFRIHLIIGIIIILLSLIVNLNQLEWFMVLIAIALVIIAELFNSIIERLIDYLKPETHIQAKEIKDISAGAVLIAAIFAATIGSIIFIPKLLAIL